MSLKCKWQGHQWRPRELVSITETGPRGTREYFAFKRQCSCCSAFTFSEEREVRHGDHVPAQEPEAWVPPEVVRPIPHSSNGASRDRFPGIGGL